MTSRALTSLGRPALGAALLGAVTLGCSSLDRFDTSGDAAFCGELVRPGRFQGGLLPDGVYPPTLSLHLELEPSRLTTRATEQGPPEPHVVVGTITTDDADRGLCKDTGRPLFKGAPLRTIPELDHDQLRLLDFGEGRDHTFMAWVDSTCQGTMLAIVSLMRNDSVEMRLLKPAPLPPPDADPSRRPGFGVFYLHRDEDGCGF